MPCIIELDRNRLHTDHNNARSISLGALVPYPLGTVPGQRFRIEQWRSHLEAEGISVDFLPFADIQLASLLHRSGHWAEKITGIAGAFVRRAVEVATAPRYDVILIYRALCWAGPAILEHLLSLTRRPIIFDFDDAIFLEHTSAANKGLGWLKFPRKTASICKLSTHVVAGNSFLADYARRYNSCVTIIPSSIDVEYYRPVAGKLINERLVIGWTGSSTSQSHLEMFAPVLRELIKRRNILMRVYSDREPNLPGIPYIWRPWSPQSELEELSHFDIGIMPMPDDQWSRGKCAMKALQYMAMGVPTICSAVGANCEVIEHGRNGLLAATPEDWLHHLVTLIDEPELRGKLGRAGRQTVEEGFSMKHCATLFAQVVRKII